ncbi:Tex family protein [Larsenimonas rhizosphaerae]|uniref:Tex family protein n=1 Tax=Larsenimonas rhizosphaerae TaxID=2944682 RepID=UPI0020347732|nr:Tex family protein [Larsenimonas rhizosphaerae]MCM2131893.1 RNA-binding transcriptional accessory protein [Larsenimonas rhizosphaerae]
MTMISNDIAVRIATELDVEPRQVEAAMTLLDGGATVPFVARYRKEATGGLDDGQLRTLEERMRYLRELDERRLTILESVNEQGKLSPELEQQIRDATTKQRLEDLYLPFRKKRRTKAQIAREAGLEPLGDQLLSDPTRDPDTTAASFINDEHGIATTRDALDGARQILMERFAENAELVGRLRDRLWTDGLLRAEVVNGKEQEGAKFSDYFDHQEPLCRAPSHRALAMFRGRNEGVLTLRLELPETEGDVHPAEVDIAHAAGIKDQGRAADRWLRDVVRWTWRVKLYTHLETELLGRLRERAEGEAIQVFAANLKDLLLAAPAGAQPTLGLDPGLRTGVKVAAIDATGKFLAHDTIYPHAPKNQWADAVNVLVALCERCDIGLIAIGNGTASRETDRLAGDVVKQLAVRGRQVNKIIVSEAGASVYSASALAASEFPDLDVTIRGAVSIARRLQDPLAELVKIDPKSIGVGQYQHDVSQMQLSRSLDTVIEDCVNGVGVDLNTASSALLRRVSGLNANLADSIIAWRDQHGAFDERRQLLEVSRLGPRTFEQCAGFLRIREGRNALDASSVHPEAYPVVERIANRYQRQVGSLVGDAAFLGQLKAVDFTDEQFGLPTVTDILKELVKPGRDPRPEFNFARFQDGVEELKDLRAGMVLEGAVTNVTHFGAFVDIGVHQDGLVHISALSHTFVKDPREVVKAGDIVRVKVMDVDIPRKRIALSMRLDDDVVERAAEDKGRSRRTPSRAPQEDKPAGALAAALLKAGAREQ